MASSMVNPILNGTYKPFVPTFTHVPPTMNPYLRNSGFRGSFNPYASILGNGSPFRARSPIF